MLTIDQLDERQSGIGGSDVGAILGLNPYRSAVDVFLEKTGKVPPDDLSDNERVHFGNVLEDIVAQEYARRQCVNVRKRNNTFKHKKYDFALAHIDRSVDKATTVLECKTADAYTKGNWGKAGTDEVPDSYLVQVAWYMGILGYPWGDLAVLIGGNDFRIYNFNRDLELEEMLFRKAGEFWTNHILKDVTPPPSCDRDLETLYAMDNGKSIVATPEIEASAKILAEYKKLIKECEDLANTELFKIKAFMGEHAEVLLSEDNKKLCTWKNNKDSKRFDAKAFQTANAALYNAYTFTKRGARPFLLKIKP
ncbi:MAG: lambda-exonuclease family protein [Candidatus Thiodiazotropha endolucinida]